jgi:hypothetical protein
MVSCASGPRSSASNAKRSEVASSTVARTASAENEDRRLRILAIALMCVTVVCFTGQDTCANWLSASLPIAQIVWARYVGGGVDRAHSVAIPVAASYAPFEASTTSAERMIAIALGFLGVVIATRPGAGALQPIVLLAVAGIVCNSGYVLATRKLAGADSPQTTLAWTQVAGLVFLTPIFAVGLEAAWISGSLGGHGRDGCFRRHQPRNADRRPSLRARADVNALHLHSAHLDDHLWRRGVRAVAGPSHASGGGASCCLRRLTCRQRAKRTTCRDSRSG